MYVHPATHRSHQGPTSQQQYYWQNRPVQVEHGGSISPKNNHREFPIVDGKFVNQSMVSPQSGRRMGASIQRPVTMHSPRQSRRVPIQQTGSVLQRERAGAVRTNARQTPQQSNGRANSSQGYSVPVQTQHGSPSSERASPDFSHGMTSSMRNFNGHQTPISIPIQVLRGGESPHGSDFPHVPPPAPPYPHESLIGQKASHINPSASMHVQPQPTSPSQLPNVNVSGDLPQFTEDAPGSGDQKESSLRTGQSRMAFRGPTRQGQSPPGTPEVQQKTSKTPAPSSSERDQGYDDRDGQSEPPSKELKEIFQIMATISRLGIEVDSFRGNKKDQQYLKLEELLTRQVLSLDNIEAHGDVTVRNERKKAVHKAQGYLDALERKASIRS